MPKYTITYKVHMEGTSTVEARNKTQARDAALSAIRKKLDDGRYDGMLPKRFTITSVEEQPSDLLIYTDGGYHLYKDEGAYANIILQDDRIIRKEARVIRHETNNRGELKAIIEAVDSCPAGSTMTVRSDSQYAVNTLKGLWKRGSNPDLFERWDAIMKEKHPKVTLEWVRGHSGDKYNEMCDQLCDEAVGYDLNSWIPKKKRK